MRRAQVGYRRVLLAPFPLLFFASLALASWFPPALLSFSAGQTHSLSLDLFNISKVGDPGLGGTEPDLPAGLKLRALFEGSDTQCTGGGVMWRRGIDGRAAIRAEGVSAFVAAFGDLDINLGRSG